MLWKTTAEIQFTETLQPYNPNSSDRIKCNKIIILNLAIVTIHILFAVNLLSTIYGMYTSVYT